MLTSSPVTMDKTNTCTPIFSELEPVHLSDKTEVKQPVPVKCGGDSMCLDTKVDNNNLNLSGIIQEDKFSKGI